ncbi:hypothetical protein D9M73_282680 [compost metagenome]
MPGQAIDLVEKVVEGQALLFPQHKLALAMLAADLYGLEQVAWRIAKITRAALGRGHHFEGRARGNQLLPGSLPLFKLHIIVLQGTARP